MKVILTNPIEVIDFEDRYFFDGKTVREAFNHKDFDSLCERYYIEVKVKKKCGERNIYVYEGEYIEIKEFDFGDIEKEFEV